MFHCNGTRAGGLYPCLRLGSRNSDANHPHLSGYGIFQGAPKHWPGAHFSLSESNLPIFQSLMQGLIVVCEDLIMIIGPIYSSSIFTHFGQLPLWISNGIITLIGALVWLLHLRKLKWYNWMTGIWMTHGIRVYCMFCMCIKGEMKIFYFECFQSWDCHYCKRFYEFLWHLLNKSPSSFISIHPTCTPFVSLFL